VKRPGPKRAPAWGAEIAPGRPHRRPHRRPHGAQSVVLIVLTVLTVLVFLLALAWPTGGAFAQTAELVDRSALRVCADPANMPFSDEAQEGFENKVAALIGEKLGLPVVYTWFPQVTGFVRNTLRANKCDLIVGFAQGHELVQNTNHYYRSAYVFLAPSGSDLATVESLDDPRLKGRRLGIIAGTPPATVLALNGLAAQMRPYHLVVDRRFFAPAEEMIADMASGEIDAGILWGPIGGYYAMKSEVPMTVVPLVRETKGPRMAYRITMGIRPNEPEWKHQLNELIAANQDEINAILLDYGVPLLDEQDHAITE
jgi:quinoprotein dehydrogenase-associated probable ABC transporter substrate-binding protein